MVITRHVRSGLAVLGLAFFAAACAEEVQPEKDVVRPVKMVTISGEGTMRLLEYPGQIEAGIDADLAFEVSGKIIELSVEEGQVVEKGALLARLDARDYESRLAAERAKMGAASAEASRVQALFDAEVNSQQQLDRAQRQFDVTKANFRQAEKAVEDTRLTAPFSGTVARKLVKEFRNVQAKEPIVTLQDASRLKVQVNVPERDLALRGRTSGARLRDVKPRVTISAFPDRSFAATLEEAATTADPATRTYAVTLGFPPPADLNVRPGMTASVAIEVQEGMAGSKPAVSTRAVLMDEGTEPYVWKVDPTTLAVTRTTVVVGEVSGGNIEIRSGLSAGDVIAVSGVHQLRDGMTVRRFED